jgi:thiol-disulfide isomerase/thioredoxin
MPQVLLAVVLALAAVALAMVLRRRRPQAPPTQASWKAPTQLDRRDFTRPDAPFLVAVFSSSTCGSCQAMIDKAAVLASDQVGVEAVDAGAHAGLHGKYGIEAVPIVVVADATGVVRASFVGPASATDLWAAVAEVRQPGSSPEPGLGHPAG